MSERAFEQIGAFGANEPSRAEAGADSPITVPADDQYVVRTGKYGEAGADDPHTAEAGKQSGVETNGVNWSGQATSFEGIARPDIAEIAERWNRVREKVATAALRAGRDENAVAILLAAKFQEPERVVAALRAGGHLVGHNYIQQLEESEAALARLDAPSHRIHVIGHVQTNKAGKAIRAADCIETLDSLKLAKRLDRIQGERIESGERDRSGDPLGAFDVMIQVNSAGSESQYGVDPNKVVDLAGGVADLKNLRLIGLMLIGANTDDVAAIAASHARVRELRDAVVSAGISSCTELSMGMTGDMEIAIAEGSTQVRVGTAVFGPRPVMK